MLLNTTKSFCCPVVVAIHYRLLSLRDRSRVVPRSDSACVFTKRERSENAGFTKSRRVIGEHVSHPLVGWRTSDQDGWGLRSNLICRGIFEDFHAGSKGNLYSKIATPRHNSGRSATAGCTRENGARRITAR